MLSHATDLVNRTGRSHWLLLGILLPLLGVLLLLLGVLLLL